MRAATCTSPTRIDSGCSSTGARSQRPYGPGSPLARTCLWALCAAERSGNLFGPSLAADAPDRAVPERVIVEAHFAQGQTLTGRIGRAGRLAGIEQRQPAEVALGVEDRIGDDGRRNAPAHDR